LDQIQDTTMRYEPPVPILSNVTSGILVKQLKKKFVQQEINFR